MNTGQSKAYSLLEAITNILVGVVVAFVSQLIIFGAYGVHLSMKVNLYMTLWFTAVSMARSFLLRRVFNWIKINYERTYENDKNIQDGGYEGYGQREA